MLIEVVAQLDRRLAAEGDDDAVRLFFIDDVLHVFGGERLEVQPVRRIEVGGDGFGVVVDDDHFIPQFFERPHAVHGRIVELDALADADGAGTDDDDAALFALFDERRRLVVGVIVVRGIEIRRFGGELGGAGIDHLIDRLAVVRHALPGEFFQLMVGIAEALALFVQGAGQLFAAQALFKLDQIVELMQEPAVDLGDLKDLVYGNARLEGGKHREQALVGELFQLFAQVLPLVFVEVEGREGDLRPAHGLHDRHLEGGADRHHLARRLHARAQLALGVEELIERPLGELDHDVVDGRLEAGEGLAGDVVLDLVQRIAEGDLGGDFGDGIARRLGRERGRTRHAGVDFDDRIFEGIGVERKLAVAAALDAQFRDDLQGCAAQHLILFVCQRDGGSDDDGVARVDADGVEVFHRADGDDVAVAVAQHLELDLFPAVDVLFHQHLGDGREHEAVVRDGAQLLFVIGDAAARAAQREGGADNDGIADLVRHRHAFLYRIGDIRGDDGLADLLHGLFEQLAIFRTVDGVDVGADELDPPLIEEALFGQLAADGQARLPAQRGEQAVRPLFDDDALDRFQRQRFEVDLVGERFVRHDGGGVGVAQDDVDARRLEHAARLRARVIELRRLADDDGAGADDEYFVDIASFRHLFFLRPSWP